MFQASVPPVYAWRGAVMKQSISGTHLPEIIAYLPSFLISLPSRIFVSSSMFHSPHKHHIHPASVSFSSALHHHHHRCSDRWQNWFPFPLLTLTLTHSKLPRHSSHVPASCNTLTANHVCILHSVWVHSSISEPIGDTLHILSLLAVFCVCYVVYCTLCFMLVIGRKMCWCVWCWILLWGVMLRDFVRLLWE